MIYLYEEVNWASHQTKFVIGNQELEGFDEVKYLGIIFNKELLWKEYSLNLQAKLQKLNYLN